MSFMPLSCSCKCSRTRFDKQENVRERARIGRTIVTRMHVNDRLEAARARTIAQVPHKPTLCGFLQQNKSHALHCDICELRVATKTRHDARC